MHGVRTLFSARCLTALALLFFVYPALHADKPKAAAPAKAAPAKAAAPAKSGGAGASASHSTGSANTSHGANTSSGHSPTTTGGASHTTGSTTGSHGATGTSTGHTGTSGGAGASHGTGATGGQHYGSNTPGGHTNAAAHPGGAGGHGAPTPHGHTTMQTSHGSVTRRPDGRVAGFHDNRRGMDVHHGINGSRHVMVERGDHSRVYVGRGGRGYVQRPYMYHGHEYARRSYYHDGHYYNHYYGRYYYHGMYMNPYFPSYYYGAAFYGWAYNPWVNPIAYGWGWGGNPWYGYYGSYFTPYPVYAAPSLWLTDYLIANSLQAAYQANQAALANPAPLTPEVKALIADEVKQQVALENHEAANPNAEPDAASSSIQRLLTDGKPHVFVAGSDLDVTDAGGNECALSEGDAIQLRGQVAPDAQAANLAVLASKGGKECPRGDVVSVALQDLQDMQNHMRETIDAGLQELQKKQGQGGLPAAPAAAKAAPVESQMAAIAPPPPPESEVAAEINQQSQAADQAEKEASTDAGSGPGPNAAAPAAEPVSVDVGQTIDQVTAALGTPLKIVNLGAKKIYVFKDMKVTFLNGKVSDVQ
ncbi:MAG: hypothetical protein ABSE42_03785 [Bryobacteraceae bacterium]|jgi:hypothetical protein